MANLAGAYLDSPHVQYAALDETRRREGTSLLLSSYRTSPAVEEREAQGVFIAYDIGPAPTYPVIYYKFCGYRYQHSPPDFETWVGTSLPTSNPSGEPIRDVCVIGLWRA